jgi:hypothetical protein
VGDFSERNETKKKRGKDMKVIKERKTGGQQWR